MIFTIGAILGLVGWYICSVFGTPWYVATKNKADDIGATLLTIGSLAVLCSILTLAFKHLP